MTLLALDTSVAVPLVLRSHPDHDLVRRWRGGRSVALSGHAALETYAVLTRLPGDARLAPLDAARLIDERFDQTLTLDAGAAGRLPKTLSSLGVVGGAVYDAVVGLAAKKHDATLATRDRRALATYERVGVEIEVVG